MRNITFRPQDSQGQGPVDLGKGSRALGAVWSGFWNFLGEPGASSLMIFQGIEEEALSFNMRPLKEETQQIAGFQPFGRGMWTSFPGQDYAPGIRLPGLS